MDKFISEIYYTLFDSKSVNPDSFGISFANKDDSNIKVVEILVHLTYMYLKRQVQLSDKRMTSSDIMYTLKGNFQQKLSCKAGYKINVHLVYLPEYKNIYYSKIDLTQLDQCPLLNRFHPAILFESLIIEPDSEIANELECPILKGKLSGVHSLIYNRHQLERYSVFIFPPCNNSKYCVSLSFNQVFDWNSIG